MVISQANENIMEAFTAHQAPITALSIMPNFPDVSSDVKNIFQHILSYHLGFKFGSQFFLWLDCKAMEPQV